MTLERARSVCFAPFLFFSMVTIFKSAENFSTWKTRGVVFGLVGGLIAPILGSMLTVISWFRDPAWHGFSLHTAATLLFVAALPLLILGAHCLDLLDRDKNSEITDRREEL